MALLLQLFQGYFLNGFGVEEHNLRVGSFSEYFLKSGYTLLSEAICWIDVGSVLDVDGTGEDVIESEYLGIVGG